MRKTNEMMQGTDKHNYEDDWETEDVLDLLDSTMDEAVPIPKSLFDRMDEIRAKADENRKYEAALAKSVDITLEQAFAVAFERYEDALKELSEK